MKTLKSLTILITLFFFTSSSFAADETIEMLNKLGKEHMVYSQKIVNIFQKISKAAMPYLGVEPLIVHRKASRSLNNVRGGAY